MRFSYKFIDIDKSTALHNQATRYYYLYKEHLNRSVNELKTHNYSLCIKKKETNISSNNKVDNEEPTSLKDFRTRYNLYHDENSEQKAIKKNIEAIINTLKSPEKTKNFFQQYRQAIKNCLKLLPWWSINKMVHQDIKKNKRKLLRALYDVDNMENNYWQEFRFNCKAEIVTKIELKINKMNEDLKALSDSFSENDNIRHGEKNHNKSYHSRFNQMQKLLREISNLNGQHLATRHQCFAYHEKATELRKLLVRYEQDTKRYIKQSTQQVKLDNHDKSQKAEYKNNTAEIEKPDLIKENNNISISLIKLAEELETVTKDFITPYYQKPRYMDTQEEIWTWAKMLGTFIGSSFSGAAIFLFIIGHPLAHIVTLFAIPGLLFPIHIIWEFFRNIYHGRMPDKKNWLQVSIMFLLVATIITTIQTLTHAPMAAHLFGFTIDDTPLAMQLILAGSIITSYVITGILFVIAIYQTTRESLD